MADKDKPKLTIVGGTTIEKLEQVVDRSVLKQKTASKPIVKGHAGAKNIWGLTPKQEAFAKKVGLGECSQSQAYRESYAVGDNTLDATVYKLASAACRHPKIARRIAMYKAEKEDATSHDAAYIRSFVINTLLNIGRDTDAKASDRIKSLELLGKLDIVGAFRERIETTEVLPETTAEIEEQIERILGKTGTSD